MGVLPDWMIERDVKIVPFAPQQHRPGVISYGVTSFHIEADECIIPPNSFALAETVEYMEWKIAARVTRTRRGSTRIRKV